MLARDKWASHYAYRRFDGRSAAAIEGNQSAAREKNFSQVVYTKTANP